LQLQQAQAGSLTSLNAARAALRNNEYQSDESKQPAQLSTLARDLALTQLDLQLKTLDLNKDISHLNLRVSQVNEGLMFPVSPFAGTIERIFVKVGQNVTPGTPLAEFRGDVNTASAVILASADVAANISRFEPTTLMLRNTAVPLVLRSVSKEPTDGNLHSLIFTIPDEFAADVTNNSYVTADVPIGVSMSKAADPFLPLDAIYQTQDSAYVLVAEAQDGKLVARSHQVKLGQVFGAYVDVLEGIQSGDQVIVNRNVIDGDIVRSK
jgi:biotin carboxyl carrier protein